MPASPGFNSTGSPLRIRFSDNRFRPIAVIGTLALPMRWASPSGLQRACHSGRKGNRLRAVLSGFHRRFSGMTRNPGANARVHWLAHWPGHDDTRPLTANPLKKPVSSKHASLDELAGARHTSLGRRCAKRDTRRYQ